MTMQTSPTLSVIEQVKDNIKRTGLSTIYTTDENGLHYGYTVGLGKIGLPELVLCGLEESVTNQYMNLVYTELVKDIDNGLKIIKSGILTTVFSVDFKIIELGEHATSKLNVANFLSLEDEIELTAVQLVFPDPNNKFPDDKDVDPDYYKMQNIFCGQLH
jgi:hypothetical protein